MLVLNEEYLKFDHEVREFSDPDKVPAKANFRGREPASSLLQVDGFKSANDDLLFWHDRHFRQTYSTLRQDSPRFRRRNLSRSGRDTLPAWPAVRGNSRWRPLPHRTAPPKKRGLPAQYQARQIRRTEIRGCILFVVASPQAGRLLHPQRRYSHSIVAGGLPEMSYTTRLMPRTSLMMRLETFASRPYGRWAQCAVIKSCVCTARSATTHS